MRADHLRLDWRGFSARIPQEVQQSTQQLVSAAVRGAVEGASSGSGGGSSGVALEQLLAALSSERGSSLLTLAIRVACRCRHAPRSSCTWQGWLAADVAGMCHPRGPCAAYHCKSGCMAMLQSPPDPD
jgi:hypothetical protein